MRINLLAGLRHFRFFLGRPTLAWRTFKGYFKTIVLRQDVLRSVEFAVLFQCNYSCDKCYSKKLFKPGVDQISIDHVKRLWRECLDLGVIHVNITGGEPFIRKDLPELIRAFQPSKTLVSLVTNGSLVTYQRLAECRDAGLTSLQISLDSSKSEVHDALRKHKGSFDQVMKVASWCHDLGIIPCFSTVVCHESMNDLQNMINLAKEKNCFLLFNLAGTEGGWEGKEEVLLTKEELFKADSLRKKHPWVRQDLMFNFRGVEGCPAGLEKMYLTTHGDVYSCVYLQKHWGNFFKEELKTIWNRMRNNPEFQKKCKRCLRYENKYR